jgi:hypothetical protein
VERTMPWWELITSQHQRVYKKHWPRNSTLLSTVKISTTPEHWKQEDKPKLTKPLNA